MLSSTDPPEAREELGHFLCIFWRRFLSGLAPTVFRLGVSVLACEVCSWNFCTSFLLFFRRFLVWDMLLLVLDLAVGVCVGVDHSCNCFSFGIALFIAFPILALTLYPSG